MLYILGLVIFLVWSNYLELPTLLSLNQNCLSRRQFKDSFPIKCDIHALKNNHNYMTRHMKILTQKAKNKKHDEDDSDDDRDDDNNKKCQR